MLSFPLSQLEISADRGAQLYQAIYDRNEHAVRDLVDSCQRPNWIDVKPKLGTRSNPLMLCLTSLNILRMVLSNYEKYYIYSSDTGEALLVACASGNLEAARILLEHCNADIDSDHKGQCLRWSTRHLECIRILLQYCKTDISAYYKRMSLEHAASLGHHETIRVLLAYCNAEINDMRKCNAFEVAATNGHHETIRVLLELCNADLSTGSKYRALSNASRNGHLEAVNALLENQTVLEVAHLNNNAIFNDARTRAQDPDDAEYYQPIVDRLIQIPHVAALAAQQDQQGHDLTDEANIAENSMLALSAPQLRLIEILKKHYQAEYDDKTWDVLSVEIKSYLEDEYSKRPAKDEHGHSLPLEFATGLSEASLLAYYQHPIHTAWRYLGRPNPWMSSEAIFVQVLENGRAASIGDTDKALMGYIWLALNDETVELVEGFTVAANKILFAQNLSLLGRAHNWDKKRPILDADGKVTYKPNGKVKRERYDDLEGDKPTCGMGVTQRLLKVFYGHPYVNGPEARTLTAEIMREFMIQHLVELKTTEGEADNLIDRLNTLPVVILKDIHQELSDLLNLYEEYKERELTDDEQTQRTNALVTPEAQIQAFIERCKLWYGASRINATAPVSFICHPIEHAGYIALIKHSLANPIMSFAEKFNKYLKKRVTELECKAPQAYLPLSSSSSSSSASSSSAQCVDDSSNSAKRAAPETRKEGPRRSERLRRRQQ